MLLPARSTRCLPRWTLTLKFMKERVGVGCGLSALSWVLSRKAILARCKLFRPFIPPVVDGKLWQDYPTSVLASDRRFSVLSRGRSGTALKDMPRISILLIRASCYSLHQVSMPKLAKIATLAFRRRFWRTIRVRTALCGEVRSQLHSVLINSGGKPREAGTTGGDAGAI